MKYSYFGALILLLTACARTTTGSQAVFEHAFEQKIPQDINVVNGYLWEDRHLLVFYEETWRLELSGPGAMNFIRVHWPDLKLSLSEYHDNGDAPWFAPGPSYKYVVWKSKQNYAVTILQNRDTQHIFVAYTAL